MAIAAGLQLLSSIIGVLLLWQTLKATRGAVTEAREATRAAQDAVKVAERTRTDAMTNARRQLRAYINVETARIHYNSNTSKWESRLRFTNSGATPAYHVSIVGVLEVAETVDKFGVSSLKPIDAPGPDASRFVLGPGATRNKSDADLYDPHSLGVSKDSIEGGNYENSSRRVLVAHGKAFYRDVFGCEQVTEYLYFVGAHEGLRDVRYEDSSRDVLSYRMAAHSIGNNAT